MYLSFALVIMGFIVPMILRFDSWPWSDYPMFSQNQSVADVQILQVFRRSADGREERVRLRPARISDQMIFKGIDSGDGAALKSILFNLMLDPLPSGEHAPAALVIYEASAVDGVPARGVALRKLTEVGLP